jgi:hypothetical protein
VLDAEAGCISWRSMYQFAHFGWWLSRQLDASSGLSQAAHTVVLRRLRNPGICANLARNLSAVEMRKRSAFPNRLRRIQEYWRKWC